MKRLLSLLLVAAFAAGCVAPAPKPLPPPAEPPPGPDDGLFAEITTPRGLIVCELFFEKMPLTVASFVGLAEGTLGPEPRKPYFDGLKFHRVISGFVIQGGDPTGTGNGGPGYSFPDEFTPGLRHDQAGLLSMANSGPDTNGSQFFITLGAARYLDYVHAIFGRVVKGEDIPARILTIDTMQIKIVRRGRAAERFRADEATFKALLAAASRWQPRYFEDNTTFMSGPAPWQAKYVDYRLTNLARFTGRRVYVRLFDSFKPSTPEQATQQYVDALAAKLSHQPGALLACYFADEDQWILSSATTAAGVTIPELQPRPPPETPPATPEALNRQKQSRIYRAVEQVVSGLIDQTDPK